MGMQSHKAPGMPKFLIINPVDDSDTISIDDQKLFWSKIGMLLYLMKRLKPDKQMQLGSYLM